MPLANSAYRPTPEVELLGRRRITAEEAASSLEASLAADGKGGTSAAAAVEQPQGRRGSAASAVPGSSQVAFRQIPDIIASLRADWLPTPEEERPRCFVEVHGRISVHMHPCFMGPRLMEGLRGAAGALLLRRSSCLGCIPMGFRTLVPAGTHGAVVGESPYVHFLVDFRAVAFAPSSGTRLLGRAAETQTAIGYNVKVLNAFNIFVSKRDLPVGAQFDQAEGRWDIPGVGGGHGARGTVWLALKDHVNLKAELLDSSGLALSANAGARGLPALEDAAAQPKKRKSKGLDNVGGSPGGEAAAPQKKRKSRGEDASEAQNGRNKRKS